jgi:hypothetical protein
MSDDSTPQGTSSNVFQFPRLGFTLPPTPGTTDAPSTPSTGTPGAPDATATTPDWAAVTVPNTGRRSPLDTLAALPDPGILTPTHTTPSPQPGHIPATFHNTPGSDQVGPRLGALSLAAVLAVAVAALNGSHTVLSTWWENRQARTAENAPLREARLKHQAAMQAIGDKAAQQRAKSAGKVPSSTEFGRKTLGNRSGGSGGSAGSRSGGSAGGTKKNNGGPPGRGNGSSSSHTGPGSKNRGKNNSSLFGGGSQKKNNPGSSGGTKKPRSTDGPKPKNSPHRGSQGGSKNLLAKHRNKNKPGPGAGAGGTSKKNHGPSRTGLGTALKKDTQKAAAQRWKKRQKNGGTTPALWGSDHNNAKKQKNNPKNTPKNLKKGPGAGGNSNGTKNTPNLKKQKAGKTQGAGGTRRNLSQALWHDWKKAAARRWKKRQQQSAPGVGTPKVNLNKPKRAGTAGAGQARQQQRRQRNRQWWAKARAYAQKKATPDASAAGAEQPAGNPGPGAGAYVPPRGQQRRSPYANAGSAAGTTYTVTSDHVPGSNAKRWEPDAITPGAPALPATGPAALDAAPIKSFPRPGTSRPKEPIAMPSAKPDARIAKARNQAARTGHNVIAGARHMDAQHETEITLDDAIDEYGDFKDDAFKTHDQCFKLADRAINLRDILTNFAEELAVQNNLIGPLFSGAMARLAEAMDLVARMAEEMKTSSLEAAEMAETADNDLNDAYRPYNTATADAGLSTPSAPIHNET